jgi:SurA-like protein
MPRHGRLLASIAAAGLLLAGCGSGPSQVGAAAIVGDTRIPVAEVQSWFDEVLAKEPELRQQLQQQGQLDDRGRELASYLVQQELIELAAAAEQLSVDQEHVDAVIAQQGGAQAATAGTFMTPQRLPESVRAGLLLTELGRRYADRLSITFDYTQASTRTEAEAKARRMALGPAEAAAVLDADRKTGKVVGVGERRSVADNAELAARTPLFGARPGTVLAFEMQEQTGQWIVARIVDRNTNDVAPGAAGEQIDDATLQAIGARLLGITAENAGVRLSPRYGAWDPVALSAAPNADETVGFWLSEPKSSAAFS